MKRRSYTKAQGIERATRSIMTVVMNKLREWQQTPYQMRYDIGVHLTQIQAEAMREAMWLIDDYMILIKHRDLTVIAARKYMGMITEHAITLWLKCSLYKTDVWIPAVMIEDEARKQFVKEIAQ